MVSGVRTYLDYNATSPLRPEVRAAMTEAFALFGNPSSVHEEGRRARAAVERARAQVAALAGCEPGEVIFTSGATESNQTVMSAGWDLIAVSAIEHTSVSAGARAARRRAGAEMVELPVLADGALESTARGQLSRALHKSDGKINNALVSVQAANGEIGVIQPIGDVAAIARELGYSMHTDAVQAAGRIPLDFAGLGIDYMSLSSHKIGGPKGVGALIVRQGVSVDPLINGGGQERGWRSGTENVTGIVGFGIAAECALRDLSEIGRLRDLRDRLEERALALCGAARLVSSSTSRLANTSAVSLPGADAETLVIAFDLAGVAVSAGSACSSGKAGQNHVLRATGAPDEITRGAFRVTLGWDTRDNDVERFLAAWAGIAKNYESRAVA